MKEATGIFVRQFRVGSRTYWWVDDTFRPKPTKSEAKLRSFLKLYEVGNVVNTGLCREQQNTFSKKKEEKKRKIPPVGIEPRTS